MHGHLGLNFFILFDGIEDNVPNRLLFGIKIDIFDDDEIILFAQCDADRMVLASLLIGFRHEGVGRHDDE